MMTMLTMLNWLRDGGGYPLLAAEELVGELEPEPRGDGGDVEEKPFGV